jgi:hypothetical protein
MNNLNQALDALELACEGEAELIAFTAPNLADIIETVKTLPEVQQAAIRERLERITTIIEGKMMLYTEEMEKLGGQIRNVANNNAGTNAYRAAAVFNIKQDE